MEELKSMVPSNLKRIVAHSTLEDLPSTSSSLLHFFLSSQQFHQVVRDLAGRESGLCGKNIDAALKLKQKGNQCYLSGDHTQALSCYTQALRVAPVDAHDGDRNLVATLYVNRASLLQKMDRLVECLRDCNRALQISPSYAKAWYRRGKANVSLENYVDAICDLSIAKNMESSMGGKKQIQSELKKILDQSTKTSNKVVERTENNLRISKETLPVKLRCVTTADKGRGMTSECDIPEASLVHVEEPYAVIISKHCRETHCHYCLNELPADAIPCMSCSIPLYCSNHCQVQARGEIFENYLRKHNFSEDIFTNLEDYIARITSDNDFYPNIDHVFEHKHECHGAHWPVILPSNVVLAGRVIVKSTEERRVSTDVVNIIGALELSHNYLQVPPESKLESHIYSIVLLYCLQHSGFELPINGASISQVVILISQIRVNSLAIVRMKSNDYGPSDEFQKNVSSVNSLTSSVEQIRVGQAIYTTGSLFNHSCQPNINAYFLSRTLMIRTTEFVASGCHLELSYGPQVGEWDCEDRLKFLEDGYFFRCQCRGCSEVNISDLVINAFRCVDLHCTGVILDSSVLNCEKQKLKHFPVDPEGTSSSPSLQVGNLISDDIGSVAYTAHEGKNGAFLVDPGYCLKCGCYGDLESSHAAMDEAWKDIKRLHDAIILKEVSNDILLDALGSLSLLRSILHAYNRRIAEAEDNLAQACFSVGDLKSAGDHCKASIEILEKLYGRNHIVIGYELVKLSSIQLSLGDCNSVDSINRLVSIFLRYYGSHAYMIFPHLQLLHKDACSLVQ